MCGVSIAVYALLLFLRLLLLIAVWISEYNLSMRQEYNFETKIVPHVLTSGPTAGGTRVTLAGSDLELGVQYVVTFGGVEVAVRIDYYS